MTEYQESEKAGAPVKVGWRMSWQRVIECKSCEHAHWVEGSGRIAYACFHPQAQGKGGGWLRKCPKGQGATIILEDSD